MKIYITIPVPFGLFLNFCQFFKNRKFFFDVTQPGKPSFNLLHVQI